MTSKLTTVNINPFSTHRYSVIWLHGLGADGHDFEGIVPELALAAATNIHFIFPNAPVQPVTVNGGINMRAWYDIADSALENQVDTDGIYQSAAAIAELIKQEQAKGIKPEHILLAGFSQGGVIALHAGLRYPERLAGILALSTYLPTTRQLALERSAANNNVPIFMAHGILDLVVSIETAKAAYDSLTAMGYQITWRDYVMAHSVCVEEIQHISEFINNLFKPFP